MDSATRDKPKARSQEWRAWYKTVSAKISPDGEPWGTDAVEAEALSEIIGEALDAAGEMTAATGPLDSVT